MLRIDSTNVVALRFTMFLIVANLTFFPSEITNGIFDKHYIPSHINRFHLFLYFLRDRHIIGHRRVCSASHCFTAK